MLIVLSSVKYRTIRKGKELDNGSCLFIDC